MPRKHDAKGRSLNPDGQYLKLPYSTLHSPAWRSLGGPAVKVFLELRSRFHGSNNGRLSLSLDEGARLLGMSKTTVRRAFAELTEKGFIVMTKQGQWYGRKATEWRVTDQGCEGHPPTRDWRNWQPPEQGRKTRVSVPTRHMNGGSRCRISTEA